MVPNGQPQQLGMTEHVLHARAIGSVHKVVDVFPLIQCLGDICLPIYIGIKIFNIQHVLNFPSHHII